MHRSRPRCHAASGEKRILNGARLLLLAVASGVESQRIRREYSIGGDPLPPGALQAVFCRLDR